MTLAVRVPHGIRHTRAPRYQAESAPLDERERQRDTSGLGRQGGSVSSPDDVPRGRVRSPPCRGDRGVAIATVVLQHPNVDGVLGARDVSFQMPRRSGRQLPDATPPVYSGSIRHTGCLRTDQAARPQETEAAWKFVWHICGTQGWETLVSKVSQCQATKHETAYFGPFMRDPVALIIRRPSVQVRPAPPVFPQVTACDPTHASGDHPWAVACGTFVAHQELESAGRGSSGTCPTHVCAGQAPRLPPGTLRGEGLWHICGTRPSRIDGTPQRW